ncbi:MAG: DinB family protein [Thermomicrobiales bacterium]
MSKWALQSQVEPLLSTAEASSGSANGDSASVSAPASDLRPIDEIVEALGRLIPEFIRMTTGRSREALSQPDHDGSWSIVDAMSHLLDWERVNHDRVHRLLREDYPTLPDFDDSLWSVEHDYRDNKPADVLRELQEHRDVLIEELGRLKPAEWDQAGELEGQGEISLRWLMNSVCNHDRKHVAQAQDILA